MVQQVSSHIESSHGARGNWLIVGLLAAILAIQVLILLRMPDSPPSTKALREAKPGKERAELLQSIPLVRVEGGTIDADITGTVDVEVQNTPLEVEIYR